MYKSTYHARSPWWLQYRHMDTLSGASPASPPRTRRRLNPGKSEKGPSHDSHFHPSKPPSNAPKASTSGTDENTNRMCTLASPACNVAAPVQLGTLLPSNPKAAMNSLASSPTRVVFGGYSRNQENRQRDTSLRIQSNELAPACTRWSDLSQEKREQAKRDHEWRQNVSNKEYRRMLEEGDTSQNFAELQLFVQGR